MAVNQIFGIVGLTDISGDRLLSDLGRDRIVETVNVTRAQHNAAVNQLVDTFAERTTEYTSRVLLTGAGKLQASDENSRALPRKSAAYNVGFPILQGADAWGANWVTLQKMTVQRFSTLLTSMYNRDFASVADLLLAGLFYNTSYSYTDTDYGADITVQPLANSDTVAYPITGLTDLATDNHYLFINSTISDANNPYKLAYDELFEHGDNTGDAIAFIGTGLEAATRLLTDFVPVVDPNVTPGANVARVNGALGLNVPGNVIGYVSGSKTWISVVRRVPANYVLVIAENGPRPLKFREDVEANLRGFKPVGETDDFPFFTEQWIRRCGVGANNRVGAVVVQMSAGAYAVPTGFDPRTL